MTRKLIAGAAIVAAALTLGSASGAQYRASDQPVVTIDVAESVTVGDDSQSVPPADASVTEPVTATDDVGVFPPALAEVSEPVTVLDSILLAPAIVVNVEETVGVADEIAAVPPVSARADETVGVADSVEVALNSPPTAQAGGSYVVDEGASVRLNGIGRDPEGDALTYLWSPAAHLDDATSAQPVYSAPDDASETLTLTVTDAHGLHASSQAVVTVRNVAPVLERGPDAQVPAGGLFFRTVAFTDPGADSWTGTVDFGDGSPSQSLLAPSRSLVLSHAYSTPGTFTVRVSVRDDDGGTDSASFSVRVLNTAPQVSIGGDGTYDEGVTLTRTGTIVDTVDTWTGTVDFGDGGGATPLDIFGREISLSHVYRDNGDYPVTVRVVDSGGASGTAGFVAHVRNVAPSVGAIAGLPANALRVGTPVTLHAPFTDPGSLDTFTSTWHWGDGSASPGLIAAGSTSATHTYVLPGVYSVSTSVTDDDGGTGSSAPATILVYDTKVGSVVGAGKLNGPLGFAIAFHNNGGATRGALELIAAGRGGYVFHGDAPDWLLVTHGCALSAGTGRLDGRTGYSFAVVAVQTSGADRFRIRIWRSATGAVVEDTGAGLVTDCSSAVRIDAGVIVVRER